MQTQILTPPLKSIAVALLFSVFLGPVGLLYSSLFGGVIMILFGFVVFSAKFFVPIAIVWVASCVWSVAAANRYNKKIMDILRNEQKNNTSSYARVASLS